MKASLGLVYRLHVCLLVVLGGVLVCPAAAVPPDTPVYVGKSGKKYHRFDCKTLQNTKREVSRADAVRAGYGPCRICNPDEGGISNGSTAGYGAASMDGGTIYRVNIEKLSSYRQANAKNMLHGKVSRHIDGDTVHITLENPPAGFNRVEKIRMIGVDTPETVHPSKGVEYFGREASDFTKNALLGRDVYIALDWDTRDKYGRLLAYIYLLDGSCHNAELIKQGYAHAYTRFPFQFLEEFRTLEREARAAGAGLWAGGNRRTAKNAGLHAAARRLRGLRGASP
ncbi:MAG: thermonuclease family protein [Spirochaetaceae bacterium]|nr:thermonuclease family protein [Spirochaetaceae bacterium]